jgi:hypothetical protein
MDPSNTFACVLPWRTSWVREEKRDTLIALALETPTFCRDTHTAMLTIVLCFGYNSTDLFRARVAFLQVTTTLFVGTSELRYFPMSYRCGECLRIVRSTQIRRGSEGLFTFGGSEANAGESLGASFRCVFRSL